MDLGALPAFRSRTPTFLIIAHTDKSGPTTVLDILLADVQNKAELQSTLKRKKKEQTEELSENLAVVLSPEEVKARAEAQAEAQAKKEALAQKGPSVRDRIATIFESFNKVYEKSAKAWEEANKSLPEIFDHSDTMSLVQSRTAKAKKVGATPRSQYQNMRLGGNLYR